MHHLGPSRIVNPWNCSSSACQTHHRFTAGWGPRVEHRYRCSIVGNLVGTALWLGDGTRDVYQIKDKHLFQFLLDSLIWANRLIYGFSDGPKIGNRCWIIDFSPPAPFRRDCCVYCYRNFIEWWTIKKKIKFFLGLKLKTQMIFIKIIDYDLTCEFLCNLCY